MGDEMSLLNLFRRIRARGDASQPIKRVNEELNAALADAPVIPTAVPDRLQESVAQLDGLPPVTHPAPGGLTLRAHMELITHEAIVLEAYKDSVDVGCGRNQRERASGASSIPSQAADANPRA